MPNPSLSEIALVLDRSGSMESMAEAAVAGFNEFLRTQQAEPGDARFTLVLFDDQYEVPIQSLPIREVTPLTLEKFQPRGSTALLDAIGKTIDDLGQSLAKLQEDQRPGRVIVAILTDGFENASRHFTWHTITDRIQHQTNVYNWHFLFLGANQDAIATASQMGIAAANSATFAADATGAFSSNKAVARKMAAIRASAVGEISPDLAAPMFQILQEEDSKERNK